MPECFSRPICAYAMWLNELATDEERQRLIPCLTRLACADAPETERPRAAYIRRHARTCWYAPLMDTGLQVLEGALAIGRQADPFPAHDVKARMEAARGKAAAWIVARLTGSIDLSSDVGSGTRRGEDLHESCDGQGRSTRADPERPLLLQGEERAHDERPTRPSGRNLHLDHLEGGGSSVGLPLPRLRRDGHQPV